MHKRKAIILFVLLQIVCLIGCWDKVEIEKNAFILGLGIDLDDEDDLIITYQIALLETFKGEDDGETKTTQQISIKSKNFSNATNNLTSQLDAVPNFTHCKLIAFGEKYARKGIKGSLDFLFRETKLRRNTSVCVVEGEAKEMLNYEPKTTPSSAMVIDQIISENSVSNSQILSSQDLGYLYQHYVQGSDTCLVRVISRQNTLEVLGAGIFKDCKLIDWFSGREVTWQRFILGEVKQSILSTKLPKNQGEEITLNAYNIKASTKPKIAGDKISLVVDVLIEGDVNEVAKPENIVISDKLLLQWNKAVADDVTTGIKSIFAKAKDHHGVDIFEIDELIENYYPDFWAKNKDKWDQLYKTVTLDVDIDVKIRRIGIIDPKCHPS